MELSSDESRILVIYTGGTIGMLIGSDGYSPEPYFLTEFLRSQARFHDPLQDSLFSNAGSSSTYREWSNTNSGRNSPSASGTTFASSTQHTLLVGRCAPVETLGFGLVPCGWGGSGLETEVRGSELDVIEGSSALGPQLVQRCRRVRGRCRSFDPSFLGPYSVSGYMTRSARGC